MALESNEKDCLQNMVDKETEMIIRKGIDELPEIQRLIVVLRFFEDLTFGEIARIMRLSEKATFMQYADAVITLRVEFMELR